MRLWAKSLRSGNTMRAHGPQSGHRPTQAMAGRNRHPESWVRETAEGRGWLLRFRVATLFIVSLKRGVGAETISEFFGRLLEAPVGGSPRALQSVMQGVEHTILETAAAWAYDGRAQGETRPIIGAVAATFLARMLLMLMGRTCGYLLVEEEADGATTPGTRGSRRAAQPWESACVIG